MAGQIKDRIAVLKEELRVSSNRELEKGGLPGTKWLISNGLLSTWEDKDPAEFASNKLETFLNHYKVNREWWKTGEGDILLKNGTRNDKASDNNGKVVPEEVYKDLVESNSEYRLVPKVIMDDYDIVPKTHVDETNKRVREIIDAKNELINQLKQEIAELKSTKSVPGGVPAQQAQ